MLVLGDVHGEHPENRALFDRILRREDAETVLQTGDLNHYDLERDVWFIAGNNEDFDVIDELRATDPRYLGRHQHVHLVDDPVTLDGIRIAGLSGNHAPTRYELHREELAGDRRRHFVEDEVERCKEAEDVDVFLAHEAPHGILTEDGYDVGCRPIDEILDALEPAICLVGHHHRHAEGRFGPTRVVTLAPIWDRLYRLDPGDLVLTDERVDDGL